MSIFDRFLQKFTPHQQQPAQPERASPQQKARSSSAQQTAAELLHELGALRQNGDDTGIKAHLLTLMINTDAAFRVEVYQLIKVAIP